MWPLQEGHQGVTTGNPLETTATAAKLTPVETTEGNNDLTLFKQQKQHKILSVCSQKQVKSQTLVRTHIYIETNELM